MLPWIRSLPPGLDTRSAPMVQPFPGPTAAPSPGRAVLADPALLILDEPTAYGKLLHSGGPYQRIWEECEPV